VLATNDFMAAGGDNYTRFKNYPIANDFSSLEESLIAYIRKVGDVQPKVEGRIKVKSASAAPVPTPAPVVVPAAPEQAGKANIYVVQPGDSLSKIAKRYETTWQMLHRLNPIPNPNRIYPGQEIVLP
jgi:LysM repeat protein